MLCPEERDQSRLWGWERCWAPSEVLHPNARSTTGAELRCQEPVLALDTRH